MDRSDLRRRCSGAAPVFPSEPHRTTGACSTASAAASCNALFTFASGCLVHKRYVTNRECKLVCVRAAARTGVAVHAAAVGLRWPDALVRQEVARATPRRPPDMRTVAPHAQRQGAFGGINGLRPARAGPLHLIHVPLATALAGGARGAARRPTNAGQAPAQQPGFLRGSNSHERLARNLGQWPDGRSGTAVVRNERERSASTRAFTESCHAGQTWWLLACVLPAVRRSSRSRSSQPLMEPVMKDSKEMLLSKVEDLVPSPYRVRRRSGGGGRYRIGGVGRGRHEEG